MVLTALPPHPQKTQKKQQTQILNSNRHCIKQERQLFVLIVAVIAGYL